MGTPSAEQLVAVFKDYLNEIDELNDGNDEGVDLDWCGKVLRSEELIPIEASANERFDGYKLLTHYPDPCGLVDRIFLCAPNGDDVVEIHYGFGDTIQEIFLYPNKPVIDRHPELFENFDIDLACRNKQVDVILYNLFYYHVNNPKK